MNYKSGHEHHVTAPEDRVPLKNKILYGSGSFADMTWQWGLFALAFPVFNVIFGFSPILIGWVLGITRIWDAITDPLMGSISDNSRTRFGRRRPYIALGAVLAGTFYAVLWLVPEGLSDRGFFIYFLVTSLLFYTSFTIFSVPFYALGYEMSPDYHERTKMMGVRIFANSFNGVIFFPWMFWLIQRSFWESPVVGVRVVGIGTGALMMILAVVPVVTIKERIKTFVQKQDRTPVVQSIKYTLSCKPFVYLMVAFLVAILLNTLVAASFVYPIAYILCDGDFQEASLWLGMAEATHHITTLIFITPVAILSRKIGKRRACMFYTCFIAIGSLLVFVCFNPDMPWLVTMPRVFLGIGWTGFWILIPAMIADVVDYDESSTGTRREGMFGAVHFWVIKLGFAVGFMASGYVLAGTGFDIALDEQLEGTVEDIILFLTIIPAVGAAVAIFFISRYSLTEEQSYSMRKELEKRRGVS